MKQAKNWTHLLPKFAGLWVAFDKDEETVIAAGKNLKITIKKAENQGFINPPVFKVPTEMLPYVGQT